MSAHTTKDYGPPTKTYTVKSKADGFIWVFKYHLNGDLESFCIMDGSLSQRQARWLFQEGNFPFMEHLIKGWQQRLKKNFEVTVGLVDITFDAFWQAYRHRPRKAETQDYWKKMKESDKIKALSGLRGYDNFLRLESWRTKIDAIRYLKKRIYEDYG